MTPLRSSRVPVSETLPSSIAHGIAARAATNVVRSNSGIAGGAGVETTGGGLAGAGATGAGAAGSGGGWTGATLTCGIVGATAGGAAAGGVTDGAATGGNTAGAGTTGTGGTGREATGAGATGAGVTGAGAGTLATLAGVTDGVCDDVPIRNQARPPPNSSTPAAIPPMRGRLDLLPSATMSGCDRGVAIGA